MGSRPLQNPAAGPRLNPPAIESKQDDINLRGCFFCTRYAQIPAQQRVAQVGEGAGFYFARRRAAHSSGLQSPSPLMQGKRDLIRQAWSVDMIFSRSVDDRVSPFFCAGSASEEVGHGLPNPSDRFGCSLCLGFQYSNL